MATPAEIIAARVNGTYVSEPYQESVTPVSETTASTDSPRSLNDESAFPVLGGLSKASSPAAISSSASSWGPNSTGSVSAPVSAPSSSGSAPKKRSSGIVQEAFSLDAEDQLNVARPNFIKIMTSIKTNTATNIECTTSQHTKKRTFLITGKRADVKQAKRLVIQKLTKPTSISFIIPAKVRSKVIGAQGRNLKPIIEENEVKITIGHLEDENKNEGSSDDEDEAMDIYLKTVAVEIVGDIEGTKNAHDQIMAIVKEETKNLEVRIAVDDKIKAFAGKAIENIIARYPELNVSIPPFDSAFKSIIVGGKREDTLAARTEIQQRLRDLESEIVEVKVPIPQVKHQFLPIEQILKEENVLIKLPEEGKTEVSFIGEEKQIPIAQEKARKTTSQYKVEVLDMSKAHKGNLVHVKAVAALLTKNGTFSRISSEYGVSVHATPIEKLEDEAQTSIPIEIVVKNDEVENAKNAKKAIVSTVNKITPLQTKIVSDIDYFLMDKVPETLDTVEGIQYVVFKNTIVLFDVNEEDGEDFEDFEESGSVLDTADKALDSLREILSSLATKVISIPSKEQHGIEGPNGTTIRILLDSLKPGTVEVILHLNGKEQSPDEVYIHGYKAEVDQVEKDMHTIVSENKRFDETLKYKTTFAIPTSAVPRLIGKNGANLKKLRHDFGVKIDIADQKDSESATDKTLKSEVVISGIKWNADRAKIAIAEAAKKLADDTLVRIRIEAEYHRRIIGPNFSTINRLQDKYNVRIGFPSEGKSDSTDAKRNEVTIRGPSKGVSKAEEELNELYKFEKENGHKTTLHVPTKAIARVIGRNGETIRDIADSTGVDYRFKRDREQEDETGNAEIELTGSRTALKEASEKIKEIVSEVENTVTITVNVPPKYHRDLVGPSGSVMRGIISKAGGDSLSTQQYSRLLRIPHEGSDLDEVVCQGNLKIVESIVEQIKQLVAEKEATVTEKYDLAKEKHKLVVGPGGSVRLQLQEEFGVQIHIPRPNEPSTDIKLVGLPEKISALRAKLDELTKDNWSRSIDVPEAFHAWVSERGAILKRLRTEVGVDVTHGNLTRKATNLSNAAIPAPPANAVPEDETSSKFTTTEFVVSGSEKSIPWRFIGEESAAKKAELMIVEQLNKAQNVTHVAWFYSPKASSDFPKIVGPQGSRINKIRKSTGAFITVPRANEAHHDFIYLAGTEESLQKAQEAFAKLL